MKAAKAGITLIRERVLHDGRIGRTTFIGGKPIDFAIVTRKTPANHPEPLYKSAIQWQNGVKTLYETDQLYKTPYTKKNALKFSDKFVLKEGNRSTTTIIKNYNMQTVKIIKKYFDIFGKITEKEVYETVPAFGIENFKPSIVQVEELLRDAKNAYRRFITEFRNGKPFNSYMREASSTSQNSVALAELDAEKLMLEHCSAEARKTAVITPDDINYFYIKGKKV